MTTKGISMNYQKHYNLLIERAKNRNLEGYKERHHIVPCCMGGTDERDNLVELTAEEHFVAHQLLVKMYPDHDGLKWAAVLMTGHSNGKRANNKLYGWLKRQCQKACKQRTGEKNGSYGRSWYVNPKTGHRSKYLPEEVPEGYIKGKSFSFCKNCGNLNKKYSHKTCSEECAKTLIKASRNSRKITYFNEEYARKTFNDYIENDYYKSVSHYAKESGYPYSHVSLTKLWKRFIPEEEYSKHITPYKGKMGP